MSASRRPLPAAARTTAEAIVDAVAAARVADPAAYQDAAARMSTLDPDRLGTVQGAVLRSLLEDLHPGGFDGEDIKAVIEGCMRSAVGWFPDANAEVLIVVLAGALGIADPDDLPESVNHAAVTRHAPLLIAGLLAVDDRDLDGYLDRAFTEIARAETVELP